MKKLTQIKTAQDLREITEKAYRKVMKWPRWKRALKITKYSTGFRRVEPLKPEGKEEKEDDLRKV